MATKTTEKTETPNYRVKEKGAISKVWDASSESVVNTFDIAQVGTKTIANTFRLGNELLLPNIIEAKFDTQVALQESVMKLMEMGVDPEVATEYLKRNIM